MKGKEYSQEIIRNKFRLKICPECDEEKLVPNGHTDSGWILKYKCISCKTRYEFTESDMGQTLPRLESNA